LRVKQLHNSFYRLPIHDALQIASEVSSPEQIKDVYNLVKTLVAGARIYSNNNPNKTFFDWLDDIYRQIQNGGIRFQTSPYTLITEDIAHWILDCDSSSLVTLSVDHEFGQNLAMVKLPYHAFLRLKYWGQHINIDFGNIVADEEYRESFSISDQAVENGIYFKELDKPSYISYLLCLRAHQYNKEGLYEQALNDAHLALEFNPNDIGAYQVLTEIHFDLGDFAESERSLQEVALRSPNDHSLLELKGSWALDHENDPEKALVYFNQILERNSHDPYLFRSLASAHYQMGNQTNALYYLNLWIDSGLAEPSAYFLKADILYNQGEFDQAIATLDTLKSIDPSNNSATDALLGNCYNKKGALTQAFSYFTRAIAEDENIRAYLSIMQNLTHGNLDEAALNDLVQWLDEASETLYSRAAECHTILQHEPWYKFFRLKDPTGIWETSTQHYDNQDKAGSMQEIKSPTEFFHIEGDGYAVQLKKKLAELKAKHDRGPYYYGELKAEILEIVNQQARAHLLHLKIEVTANIIAQWGDRMILEDAKTIINLLLGSSLAPEEFATRLLVIEQRTTLSSSLNH